MIKGLITAVVLLLGLSLASLTYALKATADYHNEQTAITALDKTTTTQSGEIIWLTNKYNLLNSTRNPLSAYTAICTNQNTNSATGVEQTYYYPCTNQVIPAPGL